LELIPVLSFILQRGRCRGCGAAIGWFAPAVELAALLAALPCCLLLPTLALAWAGSALAWCLLALAWIDAKHYRLPDVLTLPLILAGLAEAQLLEPDTVFDRALAAACAYTSLWALAHLYARLRHRQGLGLGDAKLLAAGGAWLGTAATPYAAIAACLLALAFALALRLATGTRLHGGLRLPFGPFLAAGIYALFLIIPHRN
jgi:leader peptidase (prepilin peptidase)/N-methyltransferase